MLILIDLLPFYAILRSIPNKLLGVIAMFLAILILLIMPFTDLSRSRGIQFRPLSKLAFFIFLGNFLILMQLGAKHVESPYIEFGQLSTIIYFSYFLILMPLLSILENSFFVLANKGNNLRDQVRDDDNLYINHVLQKIRVITNKLHFVLYFLSAILFIVFLNILLIILTKFNFINFPYGLLGVEYCLDPSNHYGNLPLAEMHRQKLGLLHDYKYYYEMWESSKKQAKYNEYIVHSVNELPSRGFNCPGLSQTMNHFFEKQQAFQREHDAWYRALVSTNRKLNMVNQAIEWKQAQIRAVHRPWD